MAAFCVDIRITLNGDSVDLDSFRATVDGILRSYQAAQNAGLVVAERKAQDGDCSEDSD